MLRLRQGEAWKAALLGLLIVATGWFIFRTLRQAGAAKTLAVATPSSQPAPGQVPPKGKEMFAPRARPSAELEKIASAPDPFRPRVSTEPVTPSDQAPSLTAPPPLPPAPELGGLRLTGVISGREPVAVLSAADQSYFLRRGDLLAGGWQLVEIGSRTVVLEKTGRRVTLPLLSERQSSKSPEAR